MFNWMQDPRYQRAVQKYEALSPSDRAIANSALEAAFAGQAMEKQMALKRMAIQRQEHEGRLALGEKALELKGDLGRRRLDLGADRLSNLKKANELQQEDTGFAQTLALGNIALSGVSGYLGYKRDLMTESAIRKLISQYGG